MGFICSLPWRRGNLSYLFKERGRQVICKTTSIKMNYQGSGYSHKIKEFIEESAQKNKIKQVVNFCGIDNFRMYSLNESHGYKKTGRKLGNKGDCC